MSSIPVYSVDVLGSPEPIASEAELDPKRYGVIVERGARRGRCCRISRAWTPRASRCASQSRKPA